jgi:cytochrome c553
MGTILAAEYVDADTSAIDALRHEENPEGSYLAYTVCSECHGKDLRGGPDNFSPTLAVVAAYSLDDFRALMREGVAIGDRELDLMTDVAQSRFRHFTEAEIGSLHGFLKTLAASAPVP